ncbi:type II site-specific deoxyribonuclease [Methanohalophilus portucalensis FDF-1]|nr:type II site-specific deoxyribonuclease [Methanohalophilus portucalensis FDF-1]
MYPSDTNTLIDTQNGVLRNSSTLYPLFNDYIVELTVEFPNSIEISNKARLFSKISKENKEQDYFDVINYPDRELLQWLDVEYSLFKAIEYDRYLHFIEKPFSSIDSLVEAANTILNRRKSRAGKSLENHLSEIFTMNNLPFTSQPTTEGRKKPDFIFPGKDYYFDNNYKKNLVFLASKTTCKDRWRQILNEADRIKQKHLFTLQQGISEYQMDEMADNGVILVVPEKYKSTYPSAYSDEILSLKEFISHVESKISDVYVQSGQEDN